MNLYEYICFKGLLQLIQFNFLPPSNWKSVMRTTPAVIILCSTQIMYELLDQDQESGTESNRTRTGTRTAGQQSNGTRTRTRTVRQSLMGPGLGDRVWQSGPRDRCLRSSGTGIPIPREVLAWSRAF